MFFCCGEVGNIESMIGLGETFLITLASSSIIKFARVGSSKHGCAGSYETLCLAEVDDSSSFDDKCSLGLYA